ncbi:hypothetical protein [Streptomyces sp. NPDC001750]|uniref:hypothetical protein n=1 Tax=Streptomyces sp. NPDC001750 TaxID=3364607 RepID=UPI0036C5287E
MNDFPPDVHLVIYGPGRFPAHLPFGENGYLFTVPGSYAADTPAEMAVYCTTDDCDEWEVRDVDGSRRVWGTGNSRREAISLAFLEIARLRRSQANEIGSEAIGPTAENRT